MKRLEDYPWPCDRRNAHGPHPIGERMLTTEGDDTGVRWFREGAVVHLTRDECPGVKAHPSTLIGGGWR